MSDLRAGGTALVTGASSGIGRAVAVELAARGIGVILLARNIAKLEETAHACSAAHRNAVGIGEAGSRPSSCTRGGAPAPTVQTLPVDLAAPPARVRALEELLSKDLTVDYVFANAGVSQRSTALDTSDEVADRLWEVNYRSVVQMARALVPPMVARGDGWFAAVSSMSAYVGAPWRSTYGATKAALSAYVGTLANEMIDVPVGIHIVIPGFVRTGVSMAALHADGSTHGKMDPKQDKSIAPELAATRIMRGIERGKRRIFVGMTPPTRLMVALSSVAPGVVDLLLRKAELGAP